MAGRAFLAGYHRYGVFDLAKYWLFVARITWNYLNSLAPGRRGSNFKNTSFKFHDDVIKWKLFPRYWPFVRGIHRSPVNSPHKGQWRGALMFSLICVWINGWVNNNEAGDLRRYRAHCDVTVMIIQKRSLGNRCQIALRYMPQDFTDVTSTLVQEMAWCLQAARQVITRTNVEPDLCRHMVSLSHNKLTYIRLSSIRPR